MAKTGGLTSHIRHPAKLVSASTRHSHSLSPETPTLANEVENELPH